MPSDRSSFRTTLARVYRQALPWALALAVATCADDQSGPTRGGTGYFAFRPVYGISGSLSQFGIVADSVHIRLTRPVDQLVLDTTVFFPPDSTKLKLALPIPLETSPETLTAVIGISSGPTLLFTDSLDVSVVDGPPSVANIPTVLLTYVGPGKNVAAITLAPGDTTIFLRDTLFFSATAVDSSAAPVASFFVGWKTSDSTVAKINGAGRLIAPNLRGSVQVIGTTPTGIADTSTVTFAPVPVIITADSGTAQTGAAGDSLPALFVARVKGADSLGIAGVGVHFTALTAGGAVRDTFTLVTDVNGRVRTRGVLGTVAGPYTYQASVQGTSLVRVFGATATAAAPAAIAIGVGNNQVDSAGRALTNALSVKVTDAFGNAAPGAMVTWTRVAGGGSLASDSNATDAGGNSVNTYTLGAVGTDSIRVAISGTGAFVTLVETAINGAPATVTKVFGDTQTAVVASLLTDSLAVVVKSATNFPVVGAPVVWTVLRGGAAIPDTAYTDVNGRAAVTWTLGTASGTDSVKAQAGTVSSTFTATATAAAPSAIAIFSGDAQVDTANRALPQALVVSVTDTYGNPVLGAPVTFTRVFGHGAVGADTVTSLADNHPGTAYTFGSIPGTDSIRAKLVANGATVTFAETSVNATPASVIQTHGAGLSATVGTAFSDSLIVQVLDINDKPIALERVIWTVTSGSGSVALDTVLTDSLGFAVQHVTAGSTAGALVVNAKVVTPITPVNFALTANAGAATAIALVSGDAQTDTTGKILALPLTVHVTDAFGNAIAGAQVAWATATGSGHPNTDTTVTDLAGDAQVAYTLGALPTVDSVTATLVGTSAVVHFTETSISAAPASITAVSGGGQSAVVTTAVTDSLDAQVLDLASAPVANSTVIWTVSGGGLVLTADTTQTDAQGHTHVRVTAGTVAGTFQVQAHATGVATPATFALTVTAGTPLNISYVSGDGQTDTTGRTLAAPLVVRMTDFYGNPTAGAPVVFTFQAGTGTLSGDTVLTDTLGHAQVTLTLPGVPGFVQVHAQLVGGSGAIVFNETAISGAPAGLIKTLGDAQVDTVLATLTDSLVVVLRDGSSTPIPNAWLYWATAGVTLSADSTKTDANGRAAVRATFGSTAATFPVAVRNVDTTVAAVFTLKAKAGHPGQITLITGNGQSAPVNTALPTPLTVLVRDVYGNPADSARVSYTRLSGTGTPVPDTATTDTLGLTSAVYTLGAVAGTDSVQAKVVGDTATTVFTVTGTAGAASALVYVSGTGQTDTVHATLASPLVVQARDAGSNPVPGVWVHFTRVSGTGTVVADSAQTDVAGAASTGYVLGTVVGRDSIIATLAGTPDTVPFYNVSTPGAPKTLAKVSGDSQSVAVSAALPAPFVVRIADQFGNPIQGPTVAFDTVGTGATIAGTPAVTDAAGLATTGTVTLGATAGTFTFRATSSALPADTVLFTAVALPIGTSSQWLGTLSSNWGTAGNWSPAVVPSSSDNVFVPAAAPNEPVLDATRSIGGLQVESGASVTLNAFNLTLLGNAQVDGSINHTSGLLILSAAAGTAQGNLAGVRVTGNLTLAGTTTVADSLQLTSGSLVVGGHTLSIATAFTNNGSGAFTMTNPADSVFVGGATLYNGSTAAGLLTAGTLVLDGPFSEPSGAAVFQGSGTHTTVFNGSANQTVTFGLATLAANRFQNVVFANPSGITLGGNLAANGTASVTAGVVTGTGRTAFLGGDLSDPTSLGWNVTTTSLAGTPALLPDTILGNLDLTGTVTLAKPIVVKGNLTPNASSVLAFGGFGMRVDGSLTVSGAAQVKMQAAGDSLDVAGPVSWNGSTSAGLLTAGTLVIRGGFSVPTGSAVFQGSGTHRTVFAGSAPQTVNFGAASIAGNRFGDVVFANPSGVQLTSNAAAAGSGAVTAGVVTGSLGTTTIIIGANVTDPTSASWQVPVTQLAGTPTLLPDSFPAGVTVTGTVTLAKPLVIKGPYNATSGALALNGFALRVDSTFTTSGSAAVLMQNPADTLDVGGSVSWNGSTSAGQLTAGTAIFRGNFSEPSGATEYQATGTHTTVFAGSAPQAVTFGAQSLAGNHFQHLVIANAAGVNFTNGGAVAGDAAIAGGVITSSANQVLTVNGNVTDPTNVSWRPEVTSLTGTPTVLPDSFTRNVTVSGTVMLTHPIAFLANLSQTNGAIALGGFHVRVDSAFNLSGGGLLLMQNAADTLDIAGTATWNGSTSAGLLTAGTLILRGNFSEPSGATVFAATGTHATVFAGTVAQTATFGAQGPTGNRFQDLTVTNPAGVNFTNGASLSGTATVAGGVVTSGANQTVTVAGDIVDPTSVAWRPEITSLTGTPGVLPDSFTRNVTVSGTVTLTHPIAFRANLSQTAGTITPSGFHVRVDSAFNLSGSGALLMQNAADTLDIAGATTWNGSTALGQLTAGTLIIRGSFSEPSGSTVFSATGTHTTVFAGSAAQTATFGAQGLTGNHFQDLVIGNATGVNFTNGAAVTGNAAIAGGFVTTNVNQTITVAGNITDPTSVSWRPETTSLTGTPATLPDSFVRNVTASGTLTIAHPMAFKANLALTNGALDVNGFHVRVDSGFAVSGGGQFKMLAAADTMDVGGAFTINGSTTAGLLSAGTLILRGDFSEPSGSAVFQPSGTHTTVFAGAATHTVTFGSPNAATNRFNDLRLEGPTGLALGSNIVVTGAVSAPLGLPVTVGSTAGVRSVATRGLTINQVTFDSVRVSYSGGPIAFLQNVTFQHQDPTTVQFAIAEAGSATPEQLQNVQFLTTPTTGKYLSATDTLANGSPLTVQMFHSFPLDGTAFEQQVAGADGATIDWSSFKFLIQPVDAGVLAVLDTVQVEVKAPDGNPDANFTGNVSLAIGANPGGATLGGTTTVAAVLGVAKFSDLTLSTAGFGYTLVATTAGIAPDTSALFNITVPLPAGFTSQWFGTTNTDWSTATNWSTGTVPDSTTNVFISGVGANAPTVQTSAVKVNRLRVATGATVTIASGDSLLADSTVEAGTTIVGPGTLVLRGTGTISGQVTSQAAVLGSYAVAGTASFGFNLEVAGALSVGPDTLQVTGLLQTSGTGTLGMSDANALVDVTGPATFNGGSTAGTLTLGTLRVSGDLSAGGSFPDAFAPGGGHLTLLNGSGIQTVNFATPDSVTGSHFGRLQVSTAGTAFMLHRYDALGDITVTNGATLADSLRAGFEEHGFTTIDAGGTVAVASLRTRGAIGLAVGGTYAVGRTTYYGGSAFPINPAPYDTLVLQLTGVASGDFVVSGDLLIDGSAGPAGFDLGGHAVTVNGGVNVNGSGTLTMQNAADVLNVAGSFFTNGASTEGLLTAGTLQIGGNFRQAADVSSGAFRAAAGHTTRFTGGAGVRTIVFDSPANGATDSLNSKFGTLDLPDGVDSLGQNGVLANGVTIGGSVVNDTLFGSRLEALDSVHVLASAPILQVQQLNLWNGIVFQGATTFDVLNTTFLGGTTLPVLPYRNVQISGPALTMTGDVTATGFFGVGQNGEVGGTPGDLVVNGHVLTVGSSFATGGFGLLTMAPGDSINVGGDINFNGGNTAGHLTGGTLLGHGNFSAGNHSGDSTFVAGKAHRVILADTLPSTMYVNAATESGMQFGKLYLLDGAPRAISTFGSRLIVQDSLVLGTAGGGIGTGRVGYVLAKGPVFTVTGSAINVSSFQADSTLLVNGSYSATTTLFGGQNQLVPNLTYDDIQVLGTATLTDSLILSSGNQITIGGAGVPADLTLAGHLLRGGQFRTTEFGTLTMTNPADTVDMASLTSFDGGVETGKITAGVFLVHGTFNQGNANNDSTFFATGTNETRFSDSATVVSTGFLSMGAGASRFNNVTITGAGVAFSGPIWVGGNIGIASPTVNPVTGTRATIFGTLTDAGPIAHAWDLDTTVFLNNVAFMPDSIGGGAIFENGLSANDSVRIGGAVRSIGGAFAPNGHTVRIHGKLDIAGGGTLAMLQATDSLFVDSTVTVAGATNAASNLSAGDLQIGGSLVVSAPAGFWASGTHRTYLYGPGTRVVDFGAPGNVFRDFAYSDGTELTTDVAIQGNLTGPGEVPGTLYGVDSLLSIGGTVQQQVIFDNVRVAVGQSNPLFDVTFQDMDPTRTQVTVSGPGQVAPVDFSVIRFHTLPSTGRFIDAVDTLANSDSLIVRMLGSTPVQGTPYSAGSGEGAVRWGKLLFATLPATVDSAVPFTVIVAAQGPDGLNYNQNSLDISLAANPLGDILGGTLSQGFSAGAATFGDLVLTKPTTGVSFHVAVQFGVNDSTVVLDSATSAPITVFNPAPLGAVIWDGSAGNGLWSDTMNWSTGLAPSPTDSVFIPAGQAVTFNTVTTVGGLVLGQGASLDLQGDLTVTGRVAAGNTITSTGGTLQLTGGGMQASGTLPNTHITGSVSAVGHLAINGNLTIDGIGAELNVGGERVDVSNTLTTTNGGVLTMDGTSDSVFTADATFGGGDETNRLSAGVMVIQGTTLHETGGDPNAFNTSGTFKVVFANSGFPTNTFINDPATSHFTNVDIENPNVVDLSGGSGDDVHIMGDLNVTAGGVVSGPFVHVHGAVRSFASNDSIAINTLKLDSTLSVAGGFNTINTQFMGTGQSVPALPYNVLTLSGAQATLGGDVTARVTDVTDSLFTIGGHRLQTQFLTVNGNGRLVMTNALDSVVVDTTATIQGGDETGRLTAGGLVLNGDLNLGIGTFRATRDFGTRFASGRTHHVSASFAFEGLLTPGVDYSNHLGSVDVIGDSVVVADPGHIGLTLAGDLKLTGATWTDSLPISGGVGARVQGAVEADVGSVVAFTNFRIDSTLAITTPANYDVPVTLFGGIGQRIPGSLPYQRVLVEGNVTLDSAITPTFVWVQNGGRLDLGGHTLTVDTSLFVNDSAHLVMHDPNDSLNVLGTAWFQSDSSEGDFTEGRIRALHFHQAMSSEGKTLGFVQTGANRLAPLAGDTISMDNAGPADSRLKTIDFSTAGGPVTVHGLWATDTVIIANAATAVVADTGLPFMAGGAFVMSNGTANIPRLALQGTLDVTGGSYVVDTTVFAGFSSTQTIPSNTPYANIAVLYNAVLADSLDLLSSGHGLVVMNTGLLDLNGHTLLASRFETRNTGRLKMSVPADTLRAASAFFGGGNTSGLMTDGILQVGDFQQDGTNDPLSFAPSGTQVTEFVTVGLVPEGGYNLQLDATTAGASGSHFNRLHLLSTSGTRLFANVYVADSLYINNSVFGASYTMTGAGAIVIDNAAAVQLDTLRVGGTLFVDPSATYSVANTDYITGALGLTDGVSYQNVILDTSFVLTAPFHDTTGTLLIRGSSDLTTNGHPLDVGSLQVADQATLTMTNPADSVVVRNGATFDGGSTPGRLSAGQLLLYGNLDVGISNVLDAFEPTGTHTVRFSGSHAFHNANIVGSSNVSGNWLRNVVTADTGTLYFNRNTTVLGTLTVADSATLTTASAVTLDLYGAVAYGNDVTVKEPSADVTLNYNFTVAAGTNVTYDIKQSNFYSSTTLPALTYTEVGILDGSHIFMAQDVATSGNLTIAGTSAGNAVLDLNGHTLTTNALIVGTGGLHGRLVMSQPTDSLIVNASANFGGDDESTSLTDGVIRIGGSFTQTSNVSGSAFAATGTRTEFFGTGVHSVGFSSPAPGLSHFADLSLLDGGTLQPTTGITATGGMTIDTSSTFDGASLGSGTAEFFGKVKVLDLGQVNVGNLYNTMFFHDSLIIAPTGSYSGFNSIFQGTDGIPQATYTHMYLRQGVHLTLTHPLYMTGGLNIQNDSVFGSRADTVTIRLNGYKLGAFNLGITGYGRITMDNPADTLEIGSSAGFGGVDEDTALSAGVIRIGGTFVQNGNYSPRSYAPAGTRTEFYGSLTHSMSFANFGIGESHFADLAVVNTGTLQPLTMFNVAGTTTIGGTAHFDGASIPLGSVVDFFGAVTVQSGGDFHATSSPAYFNFYGNGGLTVQTGAATPYDVLNTGFVGNNAIPDLPYKNLFLAGTDSVISGNVTADSIMITDSTYVGTGMTLHANHGLVVDGSSTADKGVLTVDGGTLQVDSTFTTQNAGYLVSRNAANAMTVHHVLFDGGPETTNLTAGQLTVTGNFTSGIGTSFDSDTLFTVNFTGGGNHTLFLGNAVSQHFGVLSLTAASLGSDTLTLPSTTIQAYKFQASGTGLLTASPAIATLQVEGLNVSGLADSGVTIDQYTFSTQPLVFDGVTFRGFGSTAIQLRLTDNGSPTATTFNNIDFDDAASPDGINGFFVRLEDNDGPSPDVFTLIINGPDSSVGASLSFVASGSLTWLPPP